MGKLQIAIFNVGAGQSIFVYPTDQIDHAKLIDCGGNEDIFSPIDFLANNDILPKSASGKPKLGSLAITNYDNDHFCWLPKLKEKIDIWTVRFPKNITSDELKSHKEEVTDALEHLCDVKDRYIYPAPYFKPVYTVYSDYLEQHELEGELNTNHLSQILFIEFGGSKICIAGDLERQAWDKILKREIIQNHLRGTHVLVAPHHGRNNGYHESIFDFCSPEVVTISDKDIMYDTQDGMAQKYANHVAGYGVLYGDRYRKVLTTRSDGHILINFEENGSRSYQNLQV